MHTEQQLPAQRFPRAAGVAIPLFSVRDAHDVGTGEILDLIPFIDWLQAWHQTVLQLLPLNETAPGEASPYNTLSAFAIDPTYVSTAALDDLLASDPAQRWLAAANTQRRVQALRRARRRYRRATYAIKLRALEHAFDEFERRAMPIRMEAFEQFCQTHAWWLDDYALFRLLKELQGWTTWETWPDPLRQRRSAALAELVAAHPERLRFFRYVQWVAAEQWQSVRDHARERGVLVFGDLPFVCGRDSADVWAHQELFDLGSSAGAPPDAFSPHGQAWGLPLYDWAEMRRDAFAWWRGRVDHARGLYDGCRIDHVVGLYRTYAIAERPGGTSGFVPADEAEQRTQGETLIRTLRIAAGSECRLMAEDLGTVPPWVRVSLTNLGIPGYKVFRWEWRDGAYLDPRGYPELSLAMTGTHDTDTLHAWWDDLEAPHRAAVLRLLALDSNRPETSPWTPALHRALLRRLYEAGSTLTILPFQDLIGGRERINTPATVGRYNWTYRLPSTTEKLDESAEVRAAMEHARELIDGTGRYAPKRA